MKKLILSALLLSNMAWAGNNITSSTEFYCQTEKGKHVRLEFFNDQFLYEFGKNLNNPEISLRRHITNVSLQRELWAQAGGYRLGLANGAYMYNIVYGDSVRYGEFGRIEVTKNQKEIASLECRPETLYYNANGKVMRLLETLPY